MKTYKCKFCEVVHHTKQWAVDHVVKEHGELIFDYSSGVKGFDTSKKTKKELAQETTKSEEVNIEKPDEE